MVPENHTVSDIWVLCSVCFSICCLLIYPIDMCFLFSFPNTHLLLAFTVFMTLRVLLKYKFKRVVKELVIARRVQ